VDHGQLLHLRQRLDENVLQHADRPALARAAVIDAVGIFVLALGNRLLQRKRAMALEIGDELLIGAGHRRIGNVAWRDRGRQPVIRFVRRRIGEVDAVAVDVGIVLVDAPVPGEAIGIERVKQHDLGVFRRAPREALAQQPGLHARAEIALDAMRRRDEEKRLPGGARADDGGVEEQGLAVAPDGLRMHAAHDVDAGKLAGGDEGVPRLAIVGGKVFCGIGGHGYSLASENSNVAFRATPGLSRASHRWPAGRPDAEDRLSRPSDRPLEPAVRRGDDRCPRARHRRRELLLHHAQPALLAAHPGRDPRSPGPRERGRAAGPHQCASRRGRPRTLPVRCLAAARRAGVFPRCLDAGRTSAAQPGTGWRGAAARGRALLGGAERGRGFACAARDRRGGRSDAALDRRGSLVDGLDLRRCNRTRPSRPLRRSGRRGDVVLGRGSPRQPPPAALGHGRGGLHRPPRRMVALLLGRPDVGETERRSGGALRGGGMTTRAQQALVDGLEKLLRSESRVEAAWLAGSLGRGRGDEYSDVDTLALTSDGMAAEVSAALAANLAGVAKPVLVNRLYGGRVLNVVTEDWQRFDISIVQGDELNRYDARDLTLLFNRSGRNPPVHPDISYVTPPDRLLNLV